MVNGVLTKQWLYRDQLKPVAELDGAENLVSEFIYATKANTPDLVVRGGNTYRVVSDQLGSPLLAINTANSSDVPFQATYSAFGERTLVAGTDDWMLFGFAGGHYDPDTKLTRFGTRDHDSTVGRWASKDSVRFHGGQANIYVYSGNDPINSLDPYGTDSNTNWECYAAVTAACMAGCQRGANQAIRSMCSSMCGGLSRFAFCKDKDPGEPSQPDGGSCEEPQNSSDDSGNCDPSMSSCW